MWRWGFNLHFICISVTLYLAAKSKNFWIEGILAMIWLRKIKLRLASFSRSPIADVNPAILILHFLVLSTVPGNLTHFSCFSIIDIDSVFIISPLPICNAFCEIRKPKAKKNIQERIFAFILTKKAKNYLITYFGIIRNLKSTVI